MASRKIEDLNIHFQPLVRRFLVEVNNLLKNEGWEVFITDGYRDSKDQEAIYAQGRTRPGNIVSFAPPGWSWHEYGLAVDVAFKARNGSVHWIPELYQRIAPIGKSMGMIWGGDFTKILDMPHFEWHPGMTIEEIFRTKKFILKGGESDVDENTSSTFDEELKVITNLRNFFKEKSLVYTQWESTVREWAESDRRLKENIPNDLKSRDEKIKALEEGAKLAQREKVNSALNEKKVIETPLNAIKSVSSSLGSLRVRLDKFRELWNALERALRYIVAFVIIEYLISFAGDQSLREIFVDPSVFFSSPQTTVAILTALVAGFFRLLRGIRVFPKIIPKIPL
jgi:hypothetical protein